MAHTAPAQEFFELWKKQMEEGAQLWARMVGQAGPSGATAPDPLNLWRPFIEQATDTWAKTMRQGGQGVGAADAVAQGKAILDRWIAAWDKLLAETMQTEAFAQAMGKHLDQWLSAQAPLRKAAADSMEATFQALGVPSRTQVIGIARQLMDLDDRLEEIEDHVAALRARLDARAQEKRAATHRTGRRTIKATEKR